MSMHCYCYYILYPCLCIVIVIIFCFIILYLSLLITIIIICLSYNLSWLREVKLCIVAVLPSWNKEINLLAYLCHHFDSFTVAAITCLLMSSLWQFYRRRHIARNHGWFCSWIFINQIESCITSANKRWTIFGRRWWKLASIFF
jgi:hypothetical protein